MERPGALRFSIILPRPGENAGATPDALAAIAQAIESSGLEACSLTDHPFPVLDRSQTGHHALDPFATLAFLAASTQRLRLHTNIVVLPYRNPFIVAKAAGTVDHLSAGRLILGVAAGYHEPEFRALGVDFDERDELTAEGVAAIKQAWTGRPVELDGKHWRAAGNSMLPRPATSPNPPIWMGGNSVKAIERAVRWCEGWSPYDVAWPRSRDTHTRPIATTDDLARRIAEMRLVCEKYERAAPLTICFVRGRTDWLGESTESILEELAAIAELGASWMSLRLPAPSTEAFIEGVQTFAALTSPAPQVAHGGAS